MARAFGTASINPVTPLQRQPGPGDGLQIFGHPFQHALGFRAAPFPEQRVQPQLMHEAHGFRRKRDQRRFVLGCEGQGRPGPHRLGLGIGGATGRKKGADIGQRTRAGFRRASLEPSDHPGRII